VVVAVTVTGAEVSLMQVAVPLVDGSFALTMLALVVSDTDQSGSNAGVGHLPGVMLSAEKCAVFPGKTALWSAVAAAGFTVMPVTVQSSRFRLLAPMEPPSQPARVEQRKAPIRSWTLIVTSKD
jgi:hypothetical protein